MAKRKYKNANSMDPMPARSTAGGILAGRPTVGGVVGLVAIVLVIGISGGYLVSRVVGSGGSPAGSAVQDLTTPWRARLLQNPQDVEALLGLAHVHLDEQRLDDAESLYREVLSLEPKNVEAITHLGTVMLGRGQAEAALRQYDKALAVQPDYVHALWDKGNLLQQVTQDYRAAIRTWEAFIRAVGPDSPDGKTAQQFISEAREGLKNASSVGKAFGKKS
jgi:predicted Zn-dependent protease